VSRSGYPWISGTGQSPKPRTHPPKKAFRRLSFTPVWRETPPLVRGWAEGRSLRRHCTPELRRRWQKSSAGTGKAHRLSAAGFEQVGLEAELVEQASQEGIACAGAVHHRHWIGGHHAAAGAKAPGHLGTAIGDHHRWVLGQPGADHGWITAAKQPLGLFGSQLDQTGLLQQRSDGRHSRGRRPGIHRSIGVPEGGPPVHIQSDRHIGSSGQLHRRHQRRRRRR